MESDSIQLVGHQSPVPISSIVWLQGEANYTRIHYRNGGFSIVTKSLNWFEQHLNFIRIHRSAIINPTFVLEFSYKPGRSGWVRLHDDRIIPVSRNRLEFTATRLAHMTDQTYIPV